MLKLSRKFFPAISRNCSTITLDQLMAKNPPRDIEIFAIKTEKSYFTKDDKPKPTDEEYPKGYEDEFKPKPDYGEP